MRQALIPVDEDGLEPQVCVIEVCMMYAHVCGCALASLEPAASETIPRKPWPLLPQTVPYVAGQQVWAL